MESISDIQGTETDKAIQSALFNLKNSILKLNYVPLW